MHQRLSLLVERAKETTVDGIEERCANQLDKLAPQATIIDALFKEKKGRIKSVCM
jgi:hypothetical protein